MIEYGVIYGVSWVSRISWRWQAGTWEPITCVLKCAYQNLIDIELNTHKSRDINAAEVSSLPLYKRSVSTPLFVVWPLLYLSLNSFEEMAVLIRSCNIALIFQSGIFQNAWQTSM